MGSGLAKLTPPGMVVGSGVAAYELTTALLQAGLLETATAAVQGVADLPADLHRRLHSEDPKVRFFGGDSADSCMKSLERRGLVYIDDFLSWADTFQTGAELKYSALMALDFVGEAFRAREGLDNLPVCAGVS